MFEASCAACHTGAPESRAPSLDALRTRTPQAIIDSLLSGAMRPQGARLSGAERRAVAEFVTGKSIEGDVSGAQTGRCTTPGLFRISQARRDGQVGVHRRRTHAFSLRSSQVSRLTTCAD